MWEIAGSKGALKLSFGLGFGLVGTLEYVNQYSVLSSAP